MASKIIVLLICVGMFVALVGGCCADHQVETYTVGCEVSGIHYTGKYHDEPRMRVRCDEFATTLHISTSQAAKYVVGDIVVVEVEVRDGWGGEYKRYNLI
jgi:hypothetical protein